MQIGFATDIGRVREINEDYFYVDKDIGLFIVADGMGGHQAGEVASRMAIEIIAAFLKENISSNNVPSIIRESISKANHELYEKSTESANLEGMGTTVVLALLSNNKLNITNVGDSRAYLIRDNKIEQLTEDHSVVTELMQIGKITKEEARSHAMRNIVTKAIGKMEKSESAVKSIAVEEDDYILLCTDGLTDMLRNEEIRDIVTVSNSTLNEKCKELVDLANQKGGKDNITVILGYQL